MVAVAGSTLTASAEPSSSKRPTAKSSEPDSAAAAAAVAQLGDTNAEAYKDPSYHADMKEYLAVHSTAAAAAGKGKGKGTKKKGVTLPLEMFQEMQVRGTAV